MHWFTLVLRNQHLTLELSATTVPSQTCLLYLSWRSCPCLRYRQQACIIIGSPGSQCCFAAFDTVDHDILLSILANRLALDWFRSYLANRTQTFTLAGKHTFLPIRLLCTTRLSARSTWFISYTEDIVDVIERQCSTTHIRRRHTAACQCQAGRQFETPTIAE